MVSVETSGVESSASETGAPKKVKKHSAGVPSFSVQVVKV